MPKGNCGRLEIFGGLFSLIRNCLVAWWVQAKIRARGLAILSLKDSRGGGGDALSLYLNFRLDLFLTLIAISL